MTVTEEYIAKGFRTSVQVIADHAQSHPKTVAMRQKRFGIWNELSWSDVNALNIEIACALAAIGVKPGAKVGILSENRQEWVLAQFAIQAAGAVVVGMYPTSPANEIEHLVVASDAEVLFIEDQEQFDKIVEIKDRLPALRKLIVFEEKGLDRETFLDIESFAAFRAAGKAALSQHETNIKNIIASTEATTTALMVFTSGSTGAPKAAEISHHNMHAAGCLINEYFAELPSGSNILSYLPLCHVAEQNMTVINALAGRHIMNFGESLRTITQDLREVAPELFFGVPRIWEKMQSSILVDLQVANPLQAKLMQLAIASAKSRETTSRNFWSPGQKLRYQFWNLLVYRHLRSYLGLGKNKISLTAAAPISIDLLHFLRGIGINIREIWGMTETTGAATLQSDWGCCAGRVGFTPSGVEYKLGVDGELLIRGGIVFKGYYKNSKATDETIVDGWLHTGDIAKRFEDGSISIIDRKKDIMINAAGKNLTPSLIENTMKASQYVKECIVIADQRPYVAALIQIDFESVRLWAEQHGVTYTTFRSLAENKSVSELIHQEVTQRNGSLARVEQIKKFHLLTKELDHDDGEVTATMKVKRSNIVKAYAEEIQQLYA